MKRSPYPCWPRMSERGNCFPFLRKVNGTISPASSTVPRNRATQERPSGIRAIFARTVTQHRLNFSRIDLSRHSTNRLHFFHPILPSIARKISFSKWYAVRKFQRGNNARRSERPFAFRTDRFSGMGKQPITIGVLTISNKRFITFWLSHSHAIAESRGIACGKNESTLGKQYTRG